MAKAKAVQLTSKVHKLENQLQQARQKEQAWIQKQLWHRQLNKLWDAAFLNSGKIKIDLFSKHSYRIESLYNRYANSIPSPRVVAEIGKLAAKYLG